MLEPAIKAVGDFLCAKNIDVKVPFDTLEPTNDMPQLLAIMHQHAEYALRKSKGDVRMLALSLVIEETRELIAAVLAADKAETMDAIGDTLYVVIGLALRLELDACHAFEAVHASNMTKAPGSHEEPRLAGEAKGEDYVAPKWEESI